MKQMTGKTRNDEDYRRLGSTSKPTSKAGRTGTSFVRMEQVYQHVTHGIEALYEESQREPENEQSRYANTLMYALSAFLDEREILSFLRGAIHFMRVKSDDQTYTAAERLDSMTIAELISSFEMIATDGERDRNEQLLSELSSAAAKSSIPRLNQHEVGLASLRLARSSLLSATEYAMSEARKKNVAAPDFASR